MTPEAPRPAGPFDLPVSLPVGGVDYPIRTDFRDALYILDVLADPDYEPDEQAAVCLRVLFPDWRRIPPARYQEALEAASSFLDGGVAAGDGRNKSKGPCIMDWRRDAPLILPAVNRVIGREVRAMEHLHWWTFLGAYMEIGESLFSTVLSIRRKRARGEKLDRGELAFYKANRAMVDLPRRESADDAARREALKELFV